MSRHRNVRNLAEDDYDECDYYDVDDEENYYREQLREKERRAKLAAEKKAKENQAKQLLLQKQKSPQLQRSSPKSKQDQKQEKTLVSKQQQCGFNTLNVPKNVESVKSVDSSKPSISSIVSPTKSACLAPTSKGVITPIVPESSCHSVSNKNICNKNCNNVPQIPPQILAKLHSLHNVNQTISSSSTITNDDKIHARTNLSLVILGHVDAGKSTLTGRLLLTLHHVSPRLLHKYQKEATSIGKSSFALAWFTDEDNSERERGVTVDVGRVFIRTKRYELAVLDAPGHRDFVPNAIMGVAGADCGLLVVAATEGEFEAGFASGSSGREGAMAIFGGQTKEHIILARGLGVSQFVVAVNKLDSVDPPWDQNRFNHIKKEVLKFLIMSGFKEKRIRFVPVSGLTGVNVSSSSIDGNGCGGGDSAALDTEGCVKIEEVLEGWKALKTWYNGPSLIEALDGFFPAKREFEKPMRFIVNDISSEGKNVTARGKVVQGLIRISDMVTVLPVGDEVCVIGVERGKATMVGKEATAFSPKSDNPPLYANENLEDVPELQNCAWAGDTAEVTLSGIDPARLSPGCVISHSYLSLRPAVERTIEARILVMEHLTMPIIRGSQVLFHMHSIDVPAVLTNLISSSKRGQSTNDARLNPRILNEGVEAIVEITLNEKLAIEEYSECKALGRFVLRRGGDTVAVGLISKVHRCQ